MSFSLLIFLITGVIIDLFFGVFSISSIIEKKLRAALLSAFLFVAFCGFWFGGLIFLFPDSFFMALVMIPAVLLILLFFLPIGKTKGQQVGKPIQRVDERDVIFAREEYLPGTEKYDLYYATRPENREIDDKIRRLPELLAPGGKYYDPLRSAYVESQFEIQKELVDYVDGPINTQRCAIDQKDASRTIKQMALHLGADGVGIARLNPYYVYSHVGRGPELWGAEIKNDHPYAVTFAVEMDYYKVEEAPEISISEETARQYSQVQRISIVLAEFIRQLGYPARAQVPGSNYQIMLPPVAYDAGLGEIGRLGYLISPRFGARIRLGGVTTGIPLELDEPIRFGVEDFCEKCKKCALNCPPGAIPCGGKTAVRGIEKWQLDIERCYHYWRVIGTDCGLCMKVCPFSHPDRLVHSILRQGIKRSSVARSLSVFGDDLFYGKRVSFPKVETLERIGRRNDHLS